MICTTPNQQDLTNEFKRLDVDGNGVISRREFDDGRHWKGGTSSALEVCMFSTVAAATVVVALVSLV